MLHRVRRARVHRVHLPCLPLIALFAGCGDVASPGAFTPPGGGIQGVFSFVAVSLGGGGIYDGLRCAGAGVRGALGNGRPTSDAPIREGG